MKKILSAEFPANLGALIVASLLVLSPNLFAEIQSAQLQKPQPTPVYPQPYPHGDPDHECREQIPGAQYSLNRCQDLSRDLENREWQAQNDLNIANSQWQTAMAPVLTCRSRISNVQNQLNEIQNEISGQQAKKNQAEAAAVVIEQQIEEARQNALGKKFECIVIGRNQSFIATAQSSMEALQLALSQCGLNNCGKNDWQPNWNCSVKN